MLTVFELPHRPLLRQAVGCPMYRSGTIQPLCFLPPSSSTNSGLVHKSLILLFLKSQQSMKKWTDFPFLIYKLVPLSMMSFCLQMNFHKDEFDYLTFRRVVSLLIIYLLFKTSAYRPSMPLTGTMLIWPQKLY